MKLKFYGTRGSVPISNPQSIRFGGNTTCVRIYSDCLPAGLALVNDAGSGCVPMSEELLAEGNIKELTVLFTHYHFDHIQGLFLSKLLYNDNFKLRLCGPVEGEIGPRKMLENLMKPPYHPVPWKMVMSHIQFKDFDLPATWVCIAHPKGGFKAMEVDEYKKLLKGSKHIPIGQGKYSVGECLVISMYKANHPEATISYRIEEKPTGKVYAFLTDHENSDGIPQSLLRHLKDADVLVMDCQYPRSIYDQYTAGFGHGTPDYCARLAQVSGAKRLGISHHDPGAKDSDIGARLEEVRNALRGTEIEVFACSDYLEVEV